MRWLLIVLLVSLATLLFAAAGLALHIRRQRTRQRSELSAAIEPAEESDLEVKR
jgi:uncharacterized membrane protein